MEITGQVQDHMMRFFIINDRIWIQEYAAVSMNLTTKNEIFSAMIVYGFLSYENGEVRIPNKELMNKFDDMIQG